jgi:hypothetical protein
MRSNHTVLEQKLRNAFLKFVDEGLTGRQAREKLNWLVFVIHMEEFEQLSYDQQWEVRLYLEALKKVHGGM